MLWRVPGSIPCSRSGRGETTLAKLGTDTRLEEHVVCCRCGCWKNCRCSSWLSMYLTSTCLLVEFLPVHLCAFSALMLFVGWQEGHLACENEWWGAGMVICLERGADLHMAQLMPLSLTVSCFSKMQIGFTFWYRLWYWWRGTVVERRSLAGELSLSCAWPAADGWPPMWVSHPL